MYGITKLRTDIILLCDIRLSNSQNIPNGKQATTTFRTNPYGSYDFFTHSTKNKRGVGILIKKSFMVPTGMNRHSSPVSGTFSGMKMGYLLFWAVIRIVHCLVNPLGLIQTYAI
jgi:hypothetical protein